MISMLKTILFVMQQQFRQTRRQSRVPRGLHPMAWIEILEDRTLLSTFVVENTNDSGVGSLRQAMLDANNNLNMGGVDRIEFQIGSGLQTIQLVSALPAITDPVVLDATTQPGYSGTPIIQLNNGYLVGDGLTLLAGNTTIRGLLINRFIGNGIRISGVAASGNVIEGNYIGTNSLATGELHNTFNGILVENGATNNRIGTNGDGVNDVAERNIISGNQRSGIELTGSGTIHNQISGNYIGTNAASSAAIPNGVVSPQNYSGIAIRNGASNNIIGVSADGAYSAAERNIISGNAFYGVFIADAGTTNNTIAGNYIGTNSSGTRAIANGVHGVIMAEGTQNNRIGTNADGIADDLERNIISGNGSAGVRMRNLGTTGNVVAGNYIGTDVTGENALGNAVYGVSIGLQAQSNWIGVSENSLNATAEQQHNFW